MLNDHSNKIIVASAGSRKTTYIVKEALSNPTDNILILTYTIDNINQIRNYITRENGYIPTNITILSWFSFLLQECVRPYQNFVYSDKRIETVYFPPDIGKFKADRRFIKKENVKSYFLVGGKYIINEHISEFSCLCNVSLRQTPYPSTRFPPLLVSRTAAAVARVQIFYNLGSD